MSELRKVYDETLNALRVTGSGGGGGTGTMSDQDANAVAITGGTIVGITDLAVADGGTGASTAATARTNLGLGTISTQAANSVTVTGGSVTGITDLAVADGGTAASDAATAFANLKQAATTSATGVSELATTAETTTGTDTARTVTPDGLAHSEYGVRTVELLVTDPTGAAITTGDGKAYFTVPTTLNGYNLIRANAALTTVSSSGLPTVQIANVTDTVDMLTTKITIDASELTSFTALTAAVIDTTRDDVATGDLLRVDVDVAGTGAKGLMVILAFQAP